MSATREGGGIFRMNEFGSSLHSTRRAPGIDEAAPPDSGPFQRRCISEVANAPGTSTCTRTPWDWTSWASDSVKPMIPHFDALYAASNGKPSCAAIEDRLMILP